MSNNDYIAPVDHGVLSSTGSVMVGAGGGALKSFGKTMLWSVGLFALGGAGLAAWAAYAAGGAVTAVLAGIAGGIFGGLVPGAFLGAFTGAFTGLFGAGKGALEAKDRVSMEKGASRAMDMQMAAYQSMAASNDNKYNLPAQGSVMNPAMAQIDASSVDRSGTMVGQQLARA